MPVTFINWIYRYFLAVLVASFIFIAPAEATGPDYQSYQQPAPESVLELDSTFGELPDAEKQRQEQRRQRRELLKHIFWDAADLVLRPRTYYLNRQREDNPDSRAWAATSNPVVAGRCCRSASLVSSSARHERRPTDSARSTAASTRCSDW